MSETGVTPEGFVRKRLDEILLQLNTELKAIFGENFNLEPESPDGQVSGIVSESYANLWEIAEDAYQAFNPSGATGVALSNLVQINGIRRQAATPSTVDLTLTGTNATVIPAGSLVSTSDTQVQFATNADATIVAGVASVEATALLTGPIEATAGTVTVIDTPITGWDSVTNAADAVLGTNEETDAELRARRERSIARDATSIIDSIVAEVLAVPGVTALTVLENDTNATVNGIPPYNTYVIVRGGDDDAIGQAIFVKKTIGSPTFGTTTVQVPDSQGINHPINFSRPTERDIYVTVTLVKDSDYPSDGDDQIKQAIVDYANGILVAGRGFGLGDDVIYSELYTPINTVDGQYVTDLRIGFAASPTGTTNLTINFDEISVFDTANIVITV